MSFVKFRRPILATGGLKTGSSTGSASTDERVVFGSALQSLGSTAGNISAAPLTIVTATATGLVYTLPTPEVGLRKRIVLDYTGATGSVTFANPTTAIFFNGSTANVITVSSSVEHLNIDLWGASATQWASIATTGSGVTYAGSTVV